MFSTVQPFLVVPSGRVILSLAFDWIGHFLYMLRMNAATRRLELYKVLVHDTDNVVNVYETLNETVQPGNCSFQLIMNPFTGYV